jgi:hypothetical protein
VNHSGDFDRYVIGERNERIRGEVQSLRLESQLQENGGRRSESRLVLLVSKSTLPLLRRAGLADYGGR